MTNFTIILIMIAVGLFIICIITAMLSMVIRHFIDKSDRRAMQSRQMRGLD